LDSYKIELSPKELLPAWDLFIEASKKGVNADGFQYDVVDITRQVLANYALILQKKWKDSYKSKNAAQFKVDSEAFLTLISDMDALLATRKDFMLGLGLARLDLGVLHHKKKHFTNRMPETWLHFGAMPTVHCTSTLIASGAVYSMIFISHVGHSFFKS
jgi:hypothetical protein